MADAADTKKEEYAKWDPYEKSNWGEVKLVEPLGEDGAAGEGEVVLVANDKKTRFAANAKALKFYSKFAQGILSGDVDEDVPLDHEMATAITLQQFCTWLKRHETVVRSKQPVPMPMLWTIDQYFSDKWDIAFIRQHFVGEDEDMTKHEPMMELAFFSTYLQCEPLTDMICTYMCWHIKNAADLDDPVAEVNRWCAGNVRNKNKHTLEETAEWIRGILKDVDPGPRRSMLSDDEYSAAPCA
eukprot:2418_1